MKKRSVSYASLKKKYLLSQENSNKIPMQHIPLDKEIKRFREHLMIAPRVNILGEVRRWKDNISLKHSSEALQTTTSFSLSIR